MKLREMLWIALRTATGVCALFVTLHGLWGAYGIEFRIDTLISVLYCLLPFSSFFIFLFVKAPKLELILHTIVAFGYLSAYSILNWRSCAELGYCGSIASTIFMTCRTKPVLAAFCVIALGIVTLLIDARRRTIADQTFAK
jgi:hypothetical protein